MNFEGFHVKNYRNIIDSGWIDANQITAFVGQNEAGKSNLFEALYTLNPIMPRSEYNLDEDWPVDRWEGRKEANGKLVCTGHFALSRKDIESLAEAARITPEVEEEEVPPPAVPLPASVRIVLERKYGLPSEFYVNGFAEGSLDEAKALAWAKANVPKFVYIHDYEMSGAQIELDQLK